MYERFIKKKNGKVYGVYYQHTIRINGVPKTFYLGSDKKKAEKKLKLLKKEYGIK